jgi:hypothetical protein
MKRECYIPRESGPREAHYLLKAWGSMMRAHNGNIIDEYGWPAETMEYKLLRGGGPGGVAQYTLPEGAVARLQRIERGALTIGSLVACLDPYPRATLYLWYVHERNAHEIASNLQKAKPSIYRFRQDGLSALWRAMQLLVAKPCEEAA